MKAPNKLDGADILCYTQNDDSQFYGTVQVAADKAEEVITGLAITKYPDEDKYYVFACNKNWEVIGDTCHHSEERAKAFAREYYEKDSINWIAK